MNAIALQEAGIGHNNPPARQMIEEDPATVYRDPALLDALLAELKAVAPDPKTLDLDTETDRKALAGAARDVSTIKTAIEKAGLAMTEDWRKKTGEVNKVKSRVVAELDGLRDTIRKPLDDYLAAVRRHEQEIQANLNWIDGAGTVVMGTTAVEIRARLDRLRTIEATEEAFGEFHLRASIAKKAAIEKLTEILPAVEEQERMREEFAAAKKKQDEEDAERRREIERQIAEERAVAAERARVEDEQRKKQEEDARRAQNTEHRAAVMRDAIAAIRDNHKVGEATARAIVTAIAAGTIPRVVIQF